METINRYIYAVTRKLPEKQRGDVEKELRGLIEDLLEEKSQGQVVKTEDIDHVLTELGNPRDLAKEYGGEQRYLVGPELFDTYLMVLKTVEAIVLTLVSVVFVAKLILSPASITAHMVGYFSSLIGAGLQVFAWITVSFGAAEHFGKGELKKTSSQNWTPAALEPVPDHKKHIHLSEPLIGMGVSIVFLVLCIFWERLGIIRISPSSMGPTLVPILDPKLASYFLPYLIGFFGIGVVREALKLVRRHWNLKLAVAVLVCNIIAVILASKVFSNPAFWNPNLLNQLLQIEGLTVGSSSFQTIQSIWQAFTTQFIYVIGVVLIFDTLRGFYRALSHQF